MLGPDSLLGTHQAARFLQVNPSTFNGWAARGHFNVIRTPGGHRRVRMAEILEFMQKTGMKIPESLQQAEQRKIAIAGLKPFEQRRLKKHLNPQDGEFVFDETGFDVLIDVGFFKPNLIICNLGVHGFAACSALKRNPNTRNVIVVLVGPVTTKTKQWAKEAKADLLLETLNVHTLGKALELIQDNTPLKRAPRGPQVKGAA